MTGRNRLTTRLGMPLLAPEQLSEVELLKLLGDLQWTNLCDLLGCRSSQIANDVGERLYASFISIHLSAGHRGCLAAFQEGDAFHAASCLRFFARQFLEGCVVFDHAPLAADPLADPLADLDPATAWSTSTLPRVYLTNALVARVAGNMRLKVFRPAGIDDREIPETDVRPAGIAEHATALQTGAIAGLELAGEIRATFGTGAAPIIYPICYESDMNGAGLLYFARYVAMMNYAERRLLQERLQPPVSHGLALHLATAERKTFYFANAPHHDRVQIHLTATAAKPAPGEPGHLAPDLVKPLEFLFRHDLYRESDGELMASSLVKKWLVVPRRRKGVLAEVERLIRRWAGS